MGCVGRTQALTYNLHYSIHMQVRRQLRDVHRHAAESYLAGGQFGDAGMEAFGKFVGALRAIRTNERVGEGQHAKVHKRGLGRHRHTVHFMSYGLRAKELAGMMNRDPHALSELAYVQTSRAMRRRLQVLSGSRDIHPSWPVRGHPCSTATPSSAR